MRSASKTSRTSLTAPLVVEILAVIDKLTKSTPVAESPILLAVFRLSVPFLLGALVSYASNISSQQQEQGKAIYAMQGQLAVMNQQSVNTNDRLSKAEAAIDQNRKALETLGSRATVLEARTGLK